MLTMSTNYRNRAVLRHRGVRLSGAYQWNRRAIFSGFSPRAMRSRAEPSRIEFQLTAKGGDFLGSAALGLDEA